MFVALWELTLVSTSSTRPYFKVSDCDQISSHEIKAYRALSPGGWGCLGELEVQPMSNQPLLLWVLVLWMLYNIEPHLVGGYLRGRHARLPPSNARANS